MQDEPNLITDGEFAKLSRSTKRTVHWYTKEGLIRPVKINSKGYRFYSTEQIIDFQVIMLLRKLNFSLPEIKKFLHQNSSKKDLFNSKRKELETELKKIQKSLKEIDSFYLNYEKEGILIKPTVRTINSIDIYFIEKVGPYSKISEYLQELKSSFKKCLRMQSFFLSSLE